MTIGFVNSRIVPVFRLHMSFTLFGSTLRMRPCPLEQECFFLHVTETSSLPENLTCLPLMMTILRSSSLAKYGISNLQIPFLTLPIRPLVCTLLVTHCMPAEYEHKSSSTRHLCHKVLWLYAPVLHPETVLLASHPGISPSVCEGITWHCTVTQQCTLELYPASNHEYVWPI